MAAHRNLWSPDTCGCEIEFEFDDEVPAEERVHTGVRIVKACPMHPQTEFTNCHDQYKHVLEQNNRRMIILGKLVDTHPELMETLPDGSKILRRDIEIPYTYTGKGKNVTLEVDLAGPIEKKHKDTLKNLTRTMENVVVK